MITGITTTLAHALKHDQMSIWDDTIDRHLLSIVRFDRSNSAIETTPSETPPD